LILSCNSAYLEDVKNIKKFDPEEFNYRHEKMVVVTEWEEFGRRVCFSFNFIFGGRKSWGYG